MHRYPIECFWICKLQEKEFSMNEKFQNSSQYILLWIILYGVETFAIFLGNSFAIVVFWKRRFHSRKTSVVLINLSVADLMVGVSAVEDIISYICLLSKASCGKDWTTKYFILGEFSGCASISFLVLVSLERLYAIVWPFRSRTTSSRTYMIVVGIVWLLSAAAPALALLSKSSEILPVEVYEWFGSVIMIACLLTVSCAYALIWSYSKRKDPRLSQNNHKRNKNLAKTLFIVTVLSLITWLPFAVVFNFSSIIESSSVINRVTRCLQLGNSFINPTVETLRMPVFRQIVKNMFLKAKTTRLNVHQRKTCPRTDAIVLAAFSNLNNTFK